MARIALQEFNGLMPRLSPTLLAESYAQTALNTQLYSKELRAWRGATLAHTSALGAATRTVYRMYDASGTSSQWITWNSVMSVARVQLGGDASESIICYIPGGATYPFQATYSMVTASQSQRLGVPAPTAAPAATVSTDGPDPDEAEEERAYVFTYVNTFGPVTQESAPSPASTSVTLHPTGSTTGITFSDTAPTTALNITHRRLYRTVVGETTVSYEFVAQIAVGTTTYADTKTTAELGEAIQTIGWATPPDALFDLVAMPSGALAAYRTNTVYFSEPFYQHAWPLAYAVTLPFTVTGLAVQGSSLLVMTHGIPYFIHGGVPGSMSVEAIQLAQPCIAYPPIASNDGAVMYASPNGLVGIAYGDRKVMTETLFAPADWAALSPSGMRAAVSNGRYFATMTAGAHINKTLVLNNMSDPLLTELDVPSLTLYTDEQTSKLYYVHSTTGNVWEFDADASSPLTYTWKSKRFSSHDEVSFSLAKVDADYSGSGSLTVKLYGDGTLITTLSPTSMVPMRVPPFKARVIEIEIGGTRSVRSVIFATTMAELRA